MMKDDGNKNMDDIRKKQDEIIERMMKILQNQTESLSEFKDKYPNVNVSKLSELQGETNVAVGEIIKAGTAYATEQFQAVDALSKEFAVQLQLATNIAQSSDKIAHFVSRGYPVEDLMEQADQLSEASNQFKKGNKTPGERADGILRMQTDAINELNEFFLEAVKVLGADNEDVKKFGTQLENLQGAYMDTQMARCGQGSTLNDTQLKDVETKNKVFEVQSTSKDFGRLLNSIEQNPKMQKALRERSGSESSNDSGIQSGHEQENENTKTTGMGSP